MRGVIGMRFTRNTVEHDTQNECPDIVQRGQRAGCAGTSGALRVDHQQHPIDGARKYSEIADLQHRRRVNNDNVRQSAQTCQLIAHPL